MDDKIAVIFCVTVIALATLVAGYFDVITDPTVIVSSVVSGLFGAAMGRAYEQQIGAGLKNFIKTKVPPTKPPADD